MSETSIFNDGEGIPIEIHSKENVYNPELIFGHLLTSSNYNKNEKKIVGGKNGFGFKLVLIYSKWGEIETIDHIRKKKYTQRFENNLTDILKPSVRKSTAKPYTKVSWLPDYERFGIEKLTDDMFNLFKKRTYDIGVVTDKSVRVKFNGKAVPNKNFEQYMDVYIGPKTESKRVFEIPHKRWEVGACLSPLDEFTQVSFVNGINTTKGGKHVDYILNQIVKKMIGYIEKKKKIRVKPATIKEQIMLFVNCVIENPSFDSQTKDCMNTPQSKFGSKCEISDKFIDKLVKNGLLERIYNTIDLENSRLKEMLNFAVNQPLNLRAANVVGHNFGLPTQSITIDIGSKHGIDKNLMVMDENGLIGKVIKSSINTGLVQLITDKNYRVSIRIGTEKALGLFIPTHGRFGILEGFEKVCDLIKVRLLILLEYLKYIPLIYLLPE